MQMIALQVQTTMVFGGWRSSWKTQVFHAGNACWADQKFIFHVNDRKVQNVSTRKLFYFLRDCFQFASMCEKSHPLKIPNARDKLCAEWEPKRAKARWGEWECVCVPFEYVNVVGTLMRRCRGHSYKTHLFAFVWMRICKWFSHQKVPRICMPYVKRNDNWTNCLFYWRNKKKRGWARKEGQKNNSMRKKAAQTCKMERTVESVSYLPYSMHNTSTHGERERHGFNGFSENENKCICRF